MPPEVEQNRDAAAQDQGRGKQEPQQRKAGEKDRHASGREDRSRNAASDRNLRYVDLRVGIVFTHGGTTQVYAITIDGYFRAVTVRAGWMPYQAMGDRSTFWAPAERSSAA